MGQVTFRIHLSLQILSFPDVEENEDKITESSLVYEKEEFSW